MGRFRGSHRGPRAGGIKQAHGAPRSRGDELSTATIHSGHVFPLLAIGGPRRHIGVSNLTEGSTLTKPGFGGAWKAYPAVPGDRHEGPSRRSEGQHGPMKFQVRQVHA